jgi:hypothetical protein
MESCFNESIYEKNLGLNIIYKYALLLEGFLTAPEGQLVRFVETKNSETVMPVFFPIQKGQVKAVEEQETIFSGISDFINKIIDFQGENVLEMKLSKKPILNNFENFVNEAEKWEGLFNEMINVEDLYCGEIVRNAKDICINNRHL